MIVTSLSASPAIARVSNMSDRTVDIDQSCVCISVGLLTRNGTSNRYRSVDDGESASRTEALRLLPVRPDPARMRGGSDHLRRQDASGSRRLLAHLEQRRPWRRRHRPIPTPWTATSRSQQEQRDRVVDDRHRTQKRLRREYGIRLTPGRRVDDGRISWRRSHEVTDHV